MPKETIAIGNTTAYRAYPEENGLKRPGLILIEEIWGVNDHLLSVADRFVAKGYSVLVPELLPESMIKALTPSLQQDLFIPERRNEIQPILRAATQPIQQPEFAAEAIDTLKACVDYLLADPSVDGTIAVVGFCFGGTYAYHLAAHDPRIKAAVPFYGHPPSAEEIPNIACPILAFYGDQDHALMETLPKLKEDMEQNGKDFEAVVYPSVGHAFFNDTNPIAYDKKMAAEAWDRTLEFLSKELSS